MCQNINKIFRVYKIYNNINDKVYIGWTSRKAKDRFLEHISYAKTSKCKTSRLYNAMRKHGVENFFVSEIWSGYCHFFSRLVEVFLIKEYKSDELGYNIGKGGNGSPCSQETKEKISKANTGKIRPEETKRKLSLINMGKTSPRKGVKLSEETKEKISKALRGVKTYSLALKGRVLPQSQRDAISCSLRGRKHTEETKEKIRNAHIGMVPSEETIEKLRRSHLGKKISEETKEKLSKGSIGRPGYFKSHKHTEESKAIMSRKSQDWWNSQKEIKGGGNEKVLS